MTSCVLKFMETALEGGKTAERVLRERPSRAHHRRGVVFEALPGYPHVSVICEAAALAHGPGDSPGRWVPITHPDGLREHSRSSGPRRVGTEVQGSLAKRPVLARELTCLQQRGGQQGSRFPVPLLSPSFSASVSSLFPF